ncbi:MAG: TRAP transporter small permease [Arenicella sp.]
MGVIKKFLNNIESYICQALLVVFVSLLFAQIVSREVFGYSIAWTEELSVYLFVWFVFFGASHAAKLAAHNRVTFQYKMMPPKLVVALEVLSDIVWLGFNFFFIYISYDFIFHKMNLFWKSQTLGVPMRYIYMVLPITFVLMSIRILQVNYLKYVKGVDVRDPEARELDELIASDAMSDSGHNDSNTGR